MRNVLLLATVSSLCLFAGCGGNSAPPLSTLSIGTATLSDGTQGAAYAQTVEASGGVAPFNQLRPLRWTWRKRQSQVQG